MLKLQMANFAHSLLRKTPTKIGVIDTFYNFNQTSLEVIKPIGQHMSYMKLQRHAVQHPFLAATIMS